MTATAVPVYYTNVDPGFPLRSEEYFSQSNMLQLARQSYPAPIGIQLESLVVIRGLSYSDLRHCCERSAQWMPWCEQA